MIRAATYAAEIGLSTARLSFIDSRLLPAQPP